MMQPDGKTVPTAQTQPLPHNKLPEYAYRVAIIAAALLLLWTAA